MDQTGNPVVEQDVRGAGAFDQLRTLERRAATIFLNQTNFLPGVLQVRGYAAEMISRTVGLEADSPQLKDQVDVRVERAGAFEKRQRGANPPHVRVVLDESVLRRPVGGTSVMREQLDHLAKMSMMDNFELAVIPLERGAHRGLRGPFEIHEVPGDGSWLFFENAHDDQIIEDPDLVEQYKETAETLMEVAVSGDELLALLKSISHSLSQRRH